MLTSLRETQGDVAARRVLLWVRGTSWTVIGHFERTGERTVMRRLDKSLDAMRTGLNAGLGEPRISGLPAHD
jgi:hypothetical protein